MSRYTHLTRGDVVVWRPMFGFGAPRETVAVNIAHDGDLMESIPWDDLHLLDIIDIHPGPWAFACQLEPLPPFQGR
jgi:hypothetical protein